MPVAGSMLDCRSLQSVKMAVGLSDCRMTRLVNRLQCMGQNGAHPPRGGLQPMRMATEISTGILRVRGTRIMKWRVCAAAIVIISAVTVAQAGSIPLEEAWTYDGPQPHGPGGGLLLDHPPHRFGGLMSDSMGSEAPGGATIYQHVADDFSLPFDAVIRRIVFLGYYHYQTSPVGDESFQINVHEPRAGDGLPGDVIFSQLVVNPFREPTGHTVISLGGGPEYRFVVDLSTPLSLQGGDTKWLSIYQVGDPASTFRWEASLGPNPWNGQAAQNEVFPDWAIYPEVNTAFQLYSIPEPSSLAIIAFTIPLLNRNLGGRGK